MIQITVNGRKRQLPQTWNELTTQKQHLIYILNLFFCNLTKTQILSAAALRLINLSAATDYRVQNAMRRHPGYEHTQTIFENIARVAEHITYIVSTPPEFTDLVFPVINKKYHTCTNILRDFTLWEYQLAENAYCEFMQTRTESALNTLVAIVCRPARKYYTIKKLFGNTQPDRRCKFDDTKIETNAAQVAKEAIGIRYATLLWFQSQRNQIIETYKPLFQKQQTTDTESRGWLDVMFLLSTPGNEDIIATTKLALVLERLAYNHRQAQKIIQHS